jgi:hypothetical protein
MISGDGKLLLHRPQDQFSGDGTVALQQGQARCTASHGSTQPGWYAWEHGSVIASASAAAARRPRTPSRQTAQSTDEASDDAALASSTTSPRASMHRLMTPPPPGVWCRACVLRAPRPSLRRADTPFCGSRSSRPRGIAAAAVHAAAPCEAGDGQHRKPLQRNRFAMPC